MFRARGYFWASTFETTENSDKKNSGCPVADGGIAPDMPAHEHTYVKKKSCLPNYLAPENGAISWFENRSELAASTSWHKHPQNLSAEVKRRRFLAGGRAGEPKCDGISLLLQTSSSKIVSHL